MDRTRLVLTTVVWVWVSVCSSHAAKNLVLGEQAAVPAGAARVPVTLADAAGVAAVSFIVNFDPDLLVLTNVTTGDLGAAFALEYKLEDGRVIVALVRDEALTGGGGTLAYLDFRVNAGAVAGMITPLALADGTVSGQHAVDLAWNQSFGSSNGVVRVVAQAHHSLSGTVWYYPVSYLPLQLSGKTVGGVAMKLERESSWTALTSSEGGYSLTEIPFGQDYSMTPARQEDQPASGVTTLDIALMRRHILGVGTMDSPYKLLAADANASGAVSTLDIVSVRRLILGLTNSLPGGLWRFVPADFVFPDAGSPWSAPTNRWHKNLQADAQGQDFIGIKIGDVNNSWLGPAKGAVAGSKRMEDTAVRFEVGSQAAQPGEKLKAKVTVRGCEGVTSAQFTLAWDLTVLRYEGLGDFGLRGLSGSNFGEALGQQGKLTCSWDDPEGTGVSATDGSTIFTVSFEVIGRPGGVSPLAFADLPTVREATVALAAATMDTQDGWIHVVGPRPVITCRRDHGTGTFVLSVPTSSGVRYVLEYTDSLSGTPWQTLAALVGDGLLQTLPDPTATNSQRFYRLRVSDSF